MYLVTFHHGPQQKHGTYISVFTDETQNHVYANERSWTANACTAVCDDGSWLMDVPHVGDEGQQLLRLRRRPVIGPTGVVQMSDELGLAGL